MAITFDVVMWCSAGILGLLAIILLPWSLRGDPSRGRLRCPRCWYAMNGAPTLVCPECGHNARSEKRLRRTRRRWRWATLALLLLPLAGALAVTPTVREKGWRASIPGGMLVTVWPLSTTEWIDHELDGAESTDPMLAELDQRIREDDLSPWALRWWAGRLSRRLRSSDSYGAADLEPLLQTLRDRRVTRSFHNVALEDVFAALQDEYGVPVRPVWSSLSEGLEIAPRARVSVDLVNATLADAVRRLNVSISEVSSWPLSWSIEPGEQPTILIGWPDPAAAGRTFVWNIAALLDDLDAHCARITPQEIGLPNGGGGSHRCCFCNMSAYPELSWRDEQVWSIVRIVQTSVDPEHWLDGGGEVGVIHAIGDRLLVRTLPQHIDEIDALLKAIATAIDEAAPAELVVDVDPDEWRAANAAMRRLQDSVIHLPATTLGAREVAGLIERSAAVPIDLGWDDLLVTGWCDDPVLSGPGDITPREALDRLAVHMSQHHHPGAPVAWTVWHEGVRFHWENDDAGCTLMRLYNVEDFLLRPGEADTENLRYAEDRMNLLIRELTGTIAPDSWVDAGGEIGWVRTVGPCLLIRTTHRLHLQIEELLAALRVKQE